MNRNLISTRSFTLLFTASLILTFRGGIPQKFLKNPVPGNSHHHDYKISERLQHRLLSRSQYNEPLKIWVYLKDKGDDSQHSLRERLDNVQQSLDKRCLRRRVKVRSDDQIVDYSDLPLFAPYTERVKSRVLKVRTASRWLNALSVEATYPQVMDLAQLHFVRKIDLVATFHRDEPPLPAPTAPPSPRRESLHLDYGNSFDQLNQINVIPLHQLGYSGQGVVVCLLDTGFRKNHEAFGQATLVAEWDFVNGDGDVAYDPLDPDDYSDSHGTGTWSILGGYTPGKLIGPAYGADFILAKIETTRFEDQIEEDYWVAGIEWAESLGAEVVSSSLGYTDWYTFKDLDGQTAVTTIAANRAVDLGVVVVNAAGNDRNDPWGHIIAPADGFQVIAVGAVDSSGEIAPFSSPGPTFDGRIKPEVCALGVDNWFAAKDQGGKDFYRQGDGTSFATPLVAGVAALILEAHPDWTPLQVYSALTSTASRSSHPDNDYGWGIVNAFLAASLGFALVTFHGYSIDDDTSGVSFGNGNGVVEPGETTELSLTLKNKSRVNATTPHVTLSSPQSSIQVIRGEVDFPSIPPSETRTSGLPFVVKITAYFRSHQAILHVEIQGPNIITRKESIRIPVSRY